MSSYDGSERRRRRLSWQGVATLIALSLAAWSTVGVAARNEEIGRVAEQNARLTRQNSQRIQDVATLTLQIRKEGRERRDQSCRQDERRHLDDVKQLRRTYKYLERLPREDWGSNLTREIVRALPQLERDARHDTAPKFCDESGIGLREPDPVVPRHRDFSRLLSPQ